MFLNLLFIIPLFLSSHGYKLKQVVVLSRHNIRTPFYKALDLEILTPKKWPTWSEDPGNLTSKGRQLERSMGTYFSDWMIHEKLFNNSCPKNQVLVYANSLQRTIESGKSFVEGAFGNCVSVYSKNITGMDPVFNIIVKNASIEFKDIVKGEMNKKLNKMDLKSVFLELNRIMDIENSTYCKADRVCNFNDVKNEIVVELNKAPTVSGALQFGWIIVDSFLMAYYDGMKIKDVAWGQIHMAKQWKTLIKILEAYHQLCFETEMLDKDIVSTLIKYMTYIFQKGKKKFYLLVGHDANIISLMSTLTFKDYALHDQIEKTPVGGKLVFQKWYDAKNNQDLLRVNYVYQSMKQLRDGIEINLKNPPHWETLQMKNCALNKSGFCLWKDFMNILNKV